MAFRKFSYTRLQKQDNYDGVQQQIAVKKYRWIVPAVISVACFLLGIGFAQAASWFVNRIELGSPPFELNEVQYHFVYNRSFSEAPSAQTDRSWREIFPLEGGFFINPTVAPTRATFSSFHQLHCLDNIRKAYHINHAAATDGQQLRDEDIHIDVRPSHVRHCIDLIRQSLMCHADTTLEILDESINGVHGFRVNHKCRDWRQLVDWTSQQQQRDHVEQIVK